MGERRPVLLTVSGHIPHDLDDQVGAGRRPRADYTVMADRFDADLVDIERALATTGWVGRLINRIGGVGALLGWYCFRHRRDHEVIVTDGEQVGLPFALLGRLFGRGPARHVMICHVLSVPKKHRLIELARIAGRIDRYVVYCTRQAEFVRDALGVPEDRIVLTPFMVDTAFFAPTAVEVPRRSMICSAGLERRDYPTLMAAVDGLDVDVVIAAASPWSKQADSTEGEQLPDNVTIRRLDLFELRELYAACEFVVMPLHAVDFQAGITTILEAMSMARPVVVTRTPGQTDTVVEGATGRYVPPGDAGPLRRVLEELLADPAEVERMGAAARRWCVEHAEVDVYARRLAAVVGALRGASG